ncbi:SUMO ligase NFI1 PWA37_002896 [Arxiozyma heterogenica]|uniref:E3 SUMO-protein transferase SIZ2 n=1 Tax=Arxiozyma heterogenica TaxID=278026 RepID=A0AAN8A6T9_9SACH|nr:hypothetical protein RI543_004478 [Kazachstania heterogenica]
MAPPASSSSNPSSNGGLTREINYAIDAMKQLKVSELKELCRSTNLPLSGRKINLQERIIQFIKDSMSIGHIDPWRPKSIVLLIQMIYQSKELPSYFDIWSEVKSGKYPTPIIRILGDAGINIQSQTSTTKTTTITPANNSHNTNTNTRSSSKSNSKKITNDSVPFKLPPFYNIQMEIPKSSYRLVKAPGRGVGAVRFTFTGHEWLKLQNDTKKYKLYLFCWPATSQYHSNPHNHYHNKEVIAFPSPNEILFNGIKITDNVKGLKNKPGTAKPANLTPHIRPPPQINTLDLIYAYTTSDFQMACYITEFISPEELLQNIVFKHPKISKKSTLNYIKKIMNEEDEDELITTSTVLSLQCPISYTRMKYPAQSRLCQHLQCFDALWYLHSQLQVPTWQCPVCSVTIPLENLVLSEYVDEILKNSDEDVEQVELSSDGSWKPFIEDEVALKQNNDRSNQNDGSDETAPVKKEVSNDVFNSDSHNNTNIHEPVVISLDSSEDEDGEEEEQTTQHGLTMNNTSDSVLPTTTEISREISTNESPENTNETNEADLPLSQYRRTSTNANDAPVPSLISGSLLGLGNGSQTQQTNINTSVNPVNPRLPPVLTTLSDQSKTNPIQSLTIPSTIQSSTSSIPANVSINKSSSLFVPTNPSPTINDNGSNNILGIGGNLPMLNLSQNIQPPIVNPFLNNNNSNNNNVYIPSSINNSTKPLPLLANTFPRNDNNFSNISTVPIPSETNQRPIAVPHSRNTNPRRSRTEVSPFIPRKQFPPPLNVLPRKRSGINNNESVRRKDVSPDNNNNSNSNNNNNDQYNSNIIINPITNQPYNDGIIVNSNTTSNIPNSLFRVNASSNNNKNSSDVIDLTSD